MTPEPEKMSLMEVGSDVFIAAGAHLLGAEALDVDGAHGRVVLTTFHGHWNRTDPDAPARTSLAENDTPIRVMLFAEGATRLADGLRTAVAGLAAAERRDAEQEPASLLDSWLDAARLLIAARPDEAGNVQRGAVSAVLDRVAGRCGVTLDPPTLRAMAFTLAAIQSAHLSSTPLRPEDPGFGDALVSAIGSFTAVLVDRIDTLATPPEGEAKP